eukprot:TRINITY_DN8499_c0_g1_i1.p1 TRINITY_DN8499_c0_g1~~TRINITY_DN8499_c0_g1_i1.p1  ORF type:complete len:355 (+),score=132.22 TRINITY_DN8499_c0_g1_i1:138-1202(+)
MPAGPAGIIASAPRYTGASSYGTTSYSTLGSSGQTYGNAYRSSQYNNSTTTTDRSRMNLGMGAGGYAARTSEYSNATAFTNTRGLTGRSSSIPATRTRRTMTPGAGTRDTRETTTTNTWEPRSTAQPSNTYGVSNNWLHRAATPGRTRAVANTTLSTSAPSKSYAWPRQQRTSRVTLILDLDETLVHSSFEPVEADLHIPVLMDGEQYIAYVKKRPYMEEFLARCVELFDVVVWTASLAVYAEPLINELCRMSRITPLKKMYRESCTQLQGGGYVKDLSTMGRSMDDVCILDNSPSVAQLQPNNLIPIVSWYEDPSDTCLRDLIPHLERLATTMNVQDIIPSLPGSTSALARQW